MNQILSSVSLILFLAWIYLVVVTLKKKARLFDDRMESGLAERRLRRLKVFLLAAGVSVPISIPVILYAIVVQPSEDGAASAVVFSILVFSALLFHIGAIGGLVIFLKGRRKASPVLSGNLSVIPGNEPMM